MSNTIKIYWNLTACEILNKILQKIKSKQLVSGFFLLTWPANIWKKTTILNLVNQLNVLPQDLILLEDPGKLDWNLYQIKVDVPEKERIIKVNEKTFLNLWARQIADFLHTTPFGNYKFVIIENIERMNISSANALLKVLEEPWENNFIFATSSNYLKILPTILSRAFIINFFPVNFDEFTKYLEENNINLSQVKQKLLYAITAGRIWLAKKLLSDNNDLLDSLEEFIQLEKQWKTIFSKFQLLKELISNNKIHSLIDALIFYYTKEGNFQKVEKLVKIKKATFLNVNIENLLFNYLIN